MTVNSANVLPFAVKGRWIVTVESERYFVRVRHRTRWFAVARRKGFEDRRHWCATRADAIGIAVYMREAHDEMEQFEKFRALYERATDLQRACIDEYLDSCAQPVSGE